MRLRILLLGFVFIANAHPAGAVRIWIDTDPSIGAPYREVDDAFALIFAFHSPELRIAGISTTYGNAGIQRTTTVARELTRRFGGSVPVFPGAGSPRDIGTRTAATEALAAALRRERLTYVALGPLTNLAAFIEQHPDLVLRIDHVVFVGGRSPEYDLKFGPKGRLTIHDANVFKDPAAARVVLKARVPLTLAPVETGARLRLEREDWKRLGGGGTGAEFLRKGSAVWLWFWTAVVGEKGGPLFDALAVLPLVNSDQVKTEKRFACLTPGGELIAKRRFSADARAVRFCTRLDSDARPFVLRRLRDNAPLFHR